MSAQVSLPETHRYIYESREMGSDGGIGAVPCIKVQVESEDMENMALMPDSMALEVSIAK